VGGNNNTRLILSSVLIGNLLFAVVGAVLLLGDGAAHPHRTQPLLTKKLQPLLARPAVVQVTLLWKAEFPVK